MFQRSNVINFHYSPKMSVSPVGCDRIFVPIISPIRRETSCFSSLKSNPRAKCSVLMRCSFQFACFKIPGDREYSPLPKCPALILPSRAWLQQRCLSMCSTQRTRSTSHQLLFIYLSFVLNRLLSAQWQTRGT